jgi:DNA-binding response OmpR family regulator
VAGDSLGEVDDERRRKGRVLRILIADDERDTVETLKAILENEGHVVQGVLNGVEVLPAARFFRPDAMILDLSVPGISGYAVAQTIRHSFTDIRRPLMIALSGIWKQTPDRLVAQQVGFDHYLVKPCDPNKLLGLLASLKHPD